MKLNTMTATVLLIGAIVMLYAVFHVCKRSEAAGYALWTLVPCAAFFAASRLARTRGRALATLIVSGFSTALAAKDYVQAAFGPRDPNEGREFGFIIVPFFQLLTALILLAVVFFTRARNPRSV